MQRRTLLKLGLGSAVVLAVAGGAVALVQPGMRDGRLTGAGQRVFAGVAPALLEGTLPTAGPDQARALAALLERIDAFVATTPDHVQAELSQLLGLLDTAAGRWGVAGLSRGWEEASTAEVAAALQSMRLSDVSLRQQAYQGLHDVVSASYFCGQESWAVLGYPGPRAV